MSKNSLLWCSGAGLFLVLVLIAAGIVYGAIFFNPLHDLFKNIFLGAALALAVIMIILSAITNYLM